MSYWIKKHLLYILLKTIIYMKDSDARKTIESIKENSFLKVHRSLRNLTGEEHITFQKRFKILYSIATKNTKLKLKLEDISDLCGEPINEISKHLGNLKSGNLLENKGGQFWRVTAKGRRVLDNITIQLFEANEDFDSLKLLMASQTHLNELAKYYGINLNVKAQILRFFNDILSEIEEKDIDLLSVSEIEKLKFLLKASEPFYERLRKDLMDDPSENNSLEVWDSFDLITKRHTIIPDSIKTLNNKVLKLGSSIDKEKALDFFLNNMKKEQGTYYLKKYQFQGFNLESNLRTNEIIFSAKKLFSREKFDLPDYDSFQVKTNTEIEKEISITNDEIDLLNLIKVSEEQKRVIDLIDLNNWMESSKTLVLLSKLSSRNQISLVNPEDKVLDSSFKMIRDSEVIINE